MCANNLQEQSPFYVFKHVSNFDSLIDDIILPQTLLYAQQNGKDFQISKEEVMAFLGIQVVMGYHVLPSTRDYWSKASDLHCPIISQALTYRRYEIIKQNLHFCDNSVQPTKVRQLTDHFNQIAPNVYQYEETVSVDEHMIKFKGNNAMKQYVKGKPVSWGFKLWLLASAKTGYVYKMDLYTGASEKGKVAALLKTLCSK